RGAALIVLAGQVAPAPVPFVEAAVRDEIPAIGEGIQALQGKSFQISSKFQDFAPVVAGVERQKVSMQFTVAVLSNGICAVTQTGRWRTGKSCCTIRFSSVR